MVIGIEAEVDPKPYRLRIFLDANALFSAARVSGAMRQMLNGLTSHGHVLVAEAYVCAEARRNLAAKAGDLALQDLDAILKGVEVSGRVRASGQATPASQSEAVSWLPEKDRPVLLAAMALRCDALVTGDKTHFGSGYRQIFGGVTLYSPAQLVLALLAKTD